MTSIQPFDHVLNFRDVGDFINNVTGSKKLRTGLFYRSARPDEASSRDRKRLTEDYKLHTIIDLRTKSEHIQQAKKRAAAIPAAAPIAPPNSVAAEPLKIPGVRYEEINFNGSAYSFALIKQLRYWSTTKLIGLMAMGYRTEAISILGTEVMADKGLIGLGIDSLTHCTAEVLEVFKVFANEKNYPILIHCTQGKDRTGITVLLVLMLLHIDTEAITADYMYTQDQLKPEREAKLAEVRSIGLPDSFADCDSDWVQAILAHIQEKYGTVEKYLLHCGVSKDMQNTVKKVLLQ